MQVVTTIQEMRQQIHEWKHDDLSVGLVPTMGYLHEGHASLIRAAVSENDRVVVSIFVNPTQFGVGEDLDSYPRDFEHDCMLCDRIGADLVFYPTISEMYAPDAMTYVEILSDMPKHLCGQTRPSHFRGVCTIVAKLFNVVTPDHAYFGQKDAQQLAIIRRMTRDLLCAVEIVGCPIIREEDGLARSSRNVYLNDTERIAARCLSKAVRLGQQLVDQGECDVRKVLSAMRQVIESEPLARIDYIEAVDSLTIEPVDAIGAGTLVALAVFIGNTRLIDNFVVES
jgi:pantoate--beta-alanine ligase